MRARIHRFLHETRASLSVEAVIIAPALIMTLFFMFTVFDIFRIDTTNSKAAYTIGDLLSRQTEEPVNQSYIDGMKDIFDYIVMEHTGTWLRVSVVRYDGDDDALRLVWSHGNTGTPPLTDETFVNIEGAIPEMSEEDIVIVVETYMPYHVNVPFISALSDFAYYNVVVTRPRFASQLCWDTDCN